MEKNTTIVWFRDDLRLSDHAALTNAATASRLVCLFVADTAPGPRPPGGASRWWLAGSLRALGQRLAAHGQRLILRRGPAAALLPALARETGARRVVWNRRYGPEGERIDAEVAAALRDAGVAVETFPGDLLHEPDGVRTAAGGAAPKVFTPFWRRVQALGPPRAPLPPPPSLPPPVPDIASDLIADWSLEPRQPDWAGGLRETWTPGEAGATARIEAMIAGGLDGYAERRERADIEGTSRLSPHLRFGEVSPAQAWHAARFAAEARATDGIRAIDAEKFIAEVGWREFSHHQLRSFPALANRNMREAFDRFPWREDEPGLAAWRRGRTGYPLVDAAMRDLWATGFMPNRLRMVAASFLIKHLLIDWRQGEAWFWDTLVDADPASNPANWQWVAGSGADAAPYFRIFNPVLQGQRADPSGDYVRRWVPELATLPTEHIHAPWQAPPLVLAGHGIRLGHTYPHRIVEHDFARRRALDAFETIKGR